MYLGLAAALAVVLGSMLVLPLLGLIGIVIIVGSILFGIVAALQYAIWARWLSRVIERERQNEQPPS